MNASTPEYDRREAEWRAAYEARQAAQGRTVPAPTDEWLHTVIERECGPVQRISDMLWAVEVARAVLTAVSERDPPPARYRHVKSGGVYEIVTLAQMESDGAEVVVYRPTNGEARTWVRPRAEFFDGRFVPA